MSDAGTLLRRYGTRQPASEWLTLRAGDLTAAFDDGSIRALCWRGQEILRGIGYLLRDRDWGTVPAQSGGLRVRCDDDAFELDFELRMRATAGELHCTAKIRGDARGNFRFTVDATADRELATNRCGFVVLHPAHCAGLRLQVTHTDGRQQDAHFPTEISPGQPLFDIRALRHFPAPDLDVSCTLLADLPHDPAGKFEMEDQRNWSDASFKTYVASLLDPWPYRLPAARVLRQSVDLSIRSAEPRAPAATRRRDTRSAPTLSVGAPTGKRFPALGIGVPAGADRLRDPERAAIKALGLGWLVLEADLGDPLVAQQMRAGQTLARACGTRLQLDLIVPDDLAPGAAADLAAATCEGAGCDPDAIRALPRAYLQSYQPTDHWPDLAPLEAYAGALRVRFRRASIGSGMLTFFTELNRKRPGADGLDFIGHATCPIVHAADDRSVMESLESLPHIAHSVHRLWPGLAYHLGPSTLAALRNPYGRAPRPNPERLRMPLADTDPRHQAAFGAAWTLGYAAAVAAQEVQVLSLHHSHGPSGPLLDPAHPDAATSGPGACVPGWNVLAALAQAQGRPLLACDGLPSALSALAWQTGGGHPAVLIANLGQADIRLACPAGSLARALHHPFQRTAPQLLQAVPHAGLWLQPYDTLLLHVPAAA